MLYLDTDAVETALAMALASQWQAQGINVSLQGLDKGDWNAAVEAGQFQMAFTETWGAPYDPHTTVTSWLTEDEGGVYALTNMSFGSGGFTQFQAAVLAVLTEANATARQSEWTAILQSLHPNAIFCPLTYVANQAVWNSALLSGVQFGTTQYDLPMKGVQCVPYMRAQAAQSSFSSSSSSSSSVPHWAIALLVVGLVGVVAAAAALMGLIHRERKGKAVFAPLMQQQSTLPTSP